MRAAKAAQAVPVVLAECQPSHRELRSCVCSIRTCGRTGDRFESAAAVWGACERRPVMKWPVENWWACVEVESCNLHLSSVNRLE